MYYPPDRWENLYKDLSRGNQWLILWSNFTHFQLRTITGNTLFSLWCLIRKHEHSKGMAEMWTGSWLDLTCPCCLKWRQADPKEMRSIGKWGSIPGSLHFMSVSLPGRMCFLQCTLTLRNSVCVPTYACVTHYLYKICPFLCMHRLHLDQTFHFGFKFLLKEKRKTLKDKESYKWAGTLIYFEQPTWTTWKPRQRVPKAY